MNSGIKQSGYNVWNAVVSKIIIHDFEKMNRHRRIFFLGGIHGVGKGSLCKLFSSRLNIECLTASRLINWAELNEDPINKSVSNIGFTQERLIVALNSYCEENGTYVLDGHFCLLDKNNEPTGIADEVFIKINPEVLLLLTAPVQIIKQRLEKRDRRSYDVGLIERMQEFEISYAKSISNLLNCELKIFSYEKSDSIIEYLNTIL
jgi:adenylate kinase